MSAAVRLVAHSRIHLQVGIFFALTHTYVCTCLYILWPGACNCHLIKGLLKKPNRGVIFMIVIPMPLLCCERNGLYYVISTRTVDILSMSISALNAI